MMLFYHLMLGMWEARTDKFGVVKTERGVLRQATFIGRISCARVSELEVSLMATSNSLSEPT